MGHEFCVGVHGVNLVHWHKWKGVQDRHNGIFYIGLKPQNGFPLFEIKHLCVCVVLEVLVCGRAWGVLCKFGGGAAE